MIRVHLIKLAQNLILHHTHSPSLPPPPPPPSLSPSPLACPCSLFSTRSLSPSVLHRTIDVPFYNTNIDHLPSDSTETYKDSVRATNSRILRYHREGKLRSSYTIYFGPATWHLWHVVAERIAEADNNDAVRRGGGAAVHEAHQRELARMHLTMVIAQGSVLPCPYCRSHFLNKVSNNDIFSVDSHSETGLYPVRVCMIFASRMISPPSPHRLTFIHLRSFFRSFFFF